jgi:hypothetical protein
MRKLLHLVFGALMKDTPYNPNILKEKDFSP